MRPEKKVAPVADRVANSLHVPLGAVERLERELARIERGIGRDGVKLHCGEALFDVRHGAGRRRVRVGVDRVVGAGRVEVRVGAEPLPHLPAKEVVHGPAELLPDDVPARRLERTQHGHQRGVRALGVAAPVDAVPEPLDPERIGAEQMPFCFAE